MKIRIGTATELKALWGNESPTQKYFVKGMNEGNIEFWTIEEEGSKSFIGELYIFWDSEDKDEADGKNRAYLCAFRIHKDFRGRGLGSMLMKRVLQRIVEKGFSEATIGVDNNDVERLTNMYKLWGFNKLVKLQNWDYHYIDINGKAEYCDEPYGLYLNRLIHKNVSRRW
jgi:ribosomal protein S18 acetylase RimI-like enzyme